MSSNHKREKISSSLNLRGEIWKVTLEGYWHLLLPPFARESFPNCTLGSAKRIFFCFFPAKNGSSCEIRKILRPASNSPEKLPALATHFFDAIRESFFFASSSCSRIRKLHIKCMHHLPPHLERGELRHSPSSELQFSRREEGKGRRDENFYIFGLFLFQTDAPLAHLPLQVYYKIFSKFSYCNL